MSEAAVIARGTMNGTSNGSTNGSGSPSGSVLIIDDEAEIREYMRLQKERTSGGIS